MIQVQKATAVPAILTAAATQVIRLAREAEFDANPAACRAPRSRRLNVPATLYNDPTVKRQLEIDQHEKCCYCEAYLKHIGYGDVEHYRPKNGFRQRAGAKLEKPGYYWLAYDWNNLLFSCKRCNIGHKRNYFPLANHPAGRAFSHNDPVSQERPLLLHPVQDDPASHIRFRRAVALAVRQSPRGRATIALCGLNRKKTLERRRTHLAHIESHDLLAEKDIKSMSQIDLVREIAKCGSPAALVRRILQAKAICESAAFDSAEFAGMVRANFPHLPRS